MIPPEHITSNHDKSSQHVDGTQPSNGPAQPDDINSTPPLPHDGQVTGLPGIFYQPSTGQASAPQPITTGPIHSLKPGRSGFISLPGRTQSSPMTPVHTKPIVANEEKQPWRALHQAAHFTVWTLTPPFIQRPTLPLKHATLPCNVHSRVTQHRIAHSTTRLMPGLQPYLAARPLYRTSGGRWLEIFLLTIALFLTGLVHIYNLFDYPQYEMDEGTYMASAWSILQGQITPYPYGYGHPPLAWLQLGLLVQPLGGFFTFGSALNAGRVVMLAYLLGSTILVYLIVRHLGGGRGTGLLALIIFAISPLSVVYHRQVLLDNISTFWLLLAIYFLISHGQHLLFVFLAALALGCSILSKEVFLFFLPATLYTVWLVTTPFQRKFAMVNFLYVVLATGSTFLLLATLKGELFPYSWQLPGDTHPHLSLIQTYIEQSQRGTLEGSVTGAFTQWLRADPILTLCSFIPALFNLTVHFKRRGHRLMALFTFSFWLLLLRGGVVLPFYFIPLIPLAAINTALALESLSQRIEKAARLPILHLALPGCLIIILLGYNSQYMPALFTQHPTSAQHEVVNWIRDTIPQDAFIVINSYLYMDLHVPGGAGTRGDATYPLAHMHFNVASDPEIRHTLLKNDWRHIDYLVVDNDMLIDINTRPEMDLLKEALHHSKLRAQFHTDTQVRAMTISIYEVQPAST